MLHSLLVSVSGDDTGNEAPSLFQWRRMISDLGAKTGGGTHIPASARKVACLLMTMFLGFFFAFLQHGKQMRLEWVGELWNVKWNQPQRLLSLYHSDSHTGRKWKDGVLPFPTEGLQCGCCTTPVLKENLNPPSHQPSPWGDPKHSDEERSVWVGTEKNSWFLVVAFLWKRVALQRFTRHSGFGYWKFPSPF